MRRREVNENEETGLVPQHMLERIGERVEEESRRLVRVEQAVADVGDHALGSLYPQKVAGRLGELEACAARPGAADLNAVRGNLPAYDLSDRRHMMSVKVRRDSANLWANYALDLRRAIGLAPKPQRGSYAGRTLVDSCAERIDALRTDGTPDWLAVSEHLPREVVRARDTQEMARAMSERAVLLVPEDHVAPLRAYVQRVARLHPESYGLQPQADGEEQTKEIEGLIARIRPICRGVSSEGFDRLATRASRALRYSRGNL